MTDASTHPQSGRRSSRRRTAATLVAGSIALGAVAAGIAPTAEAQTSPAGTSAAAQQESSLQRDLRRDVQAYLAKYGATEYASAVGLSVSLPGRRSNLDVSAGTMSFDNRRPVPGDAVWQIGSNTKAFTGVILLQLEAEHRLSIDDTLGKWLPQYPQWRDITLRRLLNMTSHIQTYDETPQMLTAYLADPHQRFSKTQLISYAAGTPPTTDPWKYSNTGYILTEMIIEKVTGSSYSHELYTRIINRLGLKDTFYRPHVYPRSVTAREPAGYFLFRDYGPLHPFYGKDVSRNTLSWTRGAGGILATLHDMTVWERALYSGRMLKPKQQAELLSIVSEHSGQPIDRTSAEDPNGFGLGVRQSHGGPFGTVWNYEGGTLGVRTLHIYLPDSGVIMAMGVNSNLEQDSIGALAVAVHATLKTHGLVK